MATRSTIAIEYADGTVGQVYCHWDGYLDHNGAILQEHYLDPFKVRELIDLGDISSLAPSIEKPEGHSFDKSVEGYTVFYGRDRGETGCEARKFRNVGEYFVKAQQEEYDYLLRNVEGVPTWFVRYYANETRWVPLTEAIAIEKEAA